jgi:hypothetical protein
MFSFLACDCLHRDTAPFPDIPMEDSYHTLDTLPEAIRECEDTSEEMSIDSAGEDPFTVGYMRFKEPPENAPSTGKISTNCRERKKQLGKGEKFSDSERADKCKGLKDTLIILERGRTQLLCQVDVATTMARLRDLSDALALNL